MLKNAMVANPRACVIGKILVVIYLQAIFCIV